MKILIIDETKLHTPNEPYSRYEEEQIAFEDGYIEGQQSILSQAIPIEQLDESLQNYMKAMGVVFFTPSLSTDFQFPKDSKGNIIFSFSQYLQEQLGGK